MTCHTCGLPEHPATDCITELKLALLRNKLVATQLYEACKGLTAAILQFDPLDCRPLEPHLPQLYLAMRQAEEEQIDA